MSKSRMVVATRYLLTSRKDGKFDKNGTKEDLGTRMVLRSYVEDRNSRENNELYVCDEEQTLINEKQREKNIIKNAEDKQKAKVSNADVVDALVNKIVETKEKPKKKVKDSKNKMTIDELKAALTEAKIEFHHKAGINKLRELFKNI